MVKGVQILEEDVYISLSTYSFGKGMNSAILPPAMSKLEEQIGIATNLGEE